MSRLRRKHLSNPRNVQKTLQKQNVNKFRKYWFLISWLENQHLAQIMTKKEANPTRSGSEIFEGRDTKPDFSVLYYQRDKLSTWKTFVSQLFRATEKLKSFAASTGLAVILDLWGPSSPPKMTKMRTDYYSFSSISRSGIFEMADLKAQIKKEQTENQIFFAKKLCFVTVLSDWALIIQCRALASMSAGRWTIPHPHLKWRILRKFHTET